MTTRGSNAVGNLLITGLIGLASAVLGTAAGAWVVVILNRRHECKTEKKRAFRAVISVQISLHQMLSDLLQISDHNRKCESECKDIYKIKFPEQDADSFWKEHRYIDLRRINRTFSLSYQNWDFSQYLSNKDGDKRDLLKTLITSRLEYEHIMSLWERRDVKLEEALRLLEKFSERGQDDLIYIENKVISIIGLKTYLELKSLTEEYCQKLPEYIIYLDKTYDKMSVYIEKYFPGYDVFSKSLADHLSEKLEMLKNEERKIQKDRIIN